MSDGHAFPSGTVTMLFTDIEGSTRLLKQLGERYGELLADHRRLAARGVRRSRRDGRSTPRATRSSSRSPAPATLSRRRSRGSVRSRRTTGRTASSAASGWACTRASRRCWRRATTGSGSIAARGSPSAAHGGQVLVSSATAELIQDDLPAGVTLRDLGEAAAEGHRPPRASLPARRRRAASAVPAGADRSEETARLTDRRRG